VYIHYGGKNKTNNENTEVVVAIVVTEEKLQKAYEYARAVDGGPYLMEVYAWKEYYRLLKIYEQQKRSK